MSFATAARWRRHPTTAAPRPSPPGTAELPLPHRRAAIAAPPGWVQVPVEPTPGMLEAGLKRKALELWKDGASPLRASTANLRPVQEVAAMQWAAMLAAAPQPSA